ncbi:putative quinol monooxygenase [Olleya sp. HaHaR_3_96]|uniref:putative quinol monooxygenase n=1 Tax=Olleya sp. HaHaR_3_96 TaxID=2745560 RepID=UPI001C4F451C|nr:putative quinol monooxygenase [Olleya sp. HaHaR_3_96]QXP58858.1 antibiotic biosynthesis monooxygenase [Olleya sp. HaHaR_3_96]
MKKSYLTIVARILVKEEHRAFVKAELLKLLDVTRAEEGNISYDLHQDNDNPNFFMFHEKWVNRELWQKHMGNKYLAHYLKVTEGKVDEFILNEMTETVN